VTPQLQEIANTLGRIERALPGATPLAQQIYERHVSGPGTGQLYYTTTDLGVVRPRNSNILYLSDVLDGRWIHRLNIHSVSSVDHDVKVYVCGAYGAEVSDAANLHPLDDGKLLMKRGRIGIVVDIPNSWFPFYLTVVEAPTGASTGEVRSIAHMQQWEPVRD